MSKLITAAFVKAECDIDTNIPNQDLDNPIKQAMDRLRFLLGKQFYDQIVSESPSFSTDNSALFDPYIKQFLAWQANELFTIKSTAIRKRTGLRTHIDEVDQAAPADVVNLHIKTAKEQTQFYKGEMINFILQEQQNGKYPLYDEDCNTSKFGTGFGISGVSRIDTQDRNLSYKVINNGN